jgi:formamidopyrimidine-DNA glycosylase
MPELPEVEVVRRGLESHVVGRTLATVEVLHPRPVRRHLAGAEDFAARTTGRLVVGAARRGKYLWLPLDSGDAVLAHLGMSGQMLVQPTGAPDERHLRVRFGLEPHEDLPRELRFVDQRMFGGLSVSPDGAELPPAPRPSNASCSTRRSSRGSATSTPTRRSGTRRSTASASARSCALSTYDACWPTSAK